MTIDALAFETHFLAHLAPVWVALPAATRGRFVVETGLLGQARAAGIEAEPLSGNEMRRMPPRPADPDASGPVALVASYGDIKVGRRLGYRRFAFLEHGIGQSYGGDRNFVANRHGSYSGGVDRDDVGLFLVPGENPAGRWRQAYPQTPAAVVGSPRLDSLPARQGGGDPVVAISFHWPANACPESGSAFGEYRPVLADLARAFPGRVIGHGHPRFIDRLARYYTRAGIEVVADFAEVCRRADVYACDNSSSMYEFASTGRPVVVLNSRHYRRAIDHGLRFWEAAGVGVNVDEPRRLVGGIQAALADDATAQREEALSMVYARRTGAAERAAAAVLDWLAARVPVAA